VRAQHQAAVGRRDEQGVLQLAGGVVTAEVERVEVEPLVLDLGPLGDLPAHRDEDVGDALGDRGERVAGADRPLGQDGDVDGLLDEHAGVALVLELGAAGVVRRLHRLQDDVDALAGVGLLGAGQAADRAGARAPPASGHRCGGAGGGELLERAARRRRRGPRRERARARTGQRVVGTGRRARCSSSRRWGSPHSLPEERRGRS
jgi:hypothetical protein